MGTDEHGDSRQIGRYRLLAQLGSGGMGRVYLGRAPDGQLVAIKRMHARFADDPEFRARFRREVEMSMRVPGAYTAAVLDADPDAAIPWSASVFIAGPSLRTALELSGPLPEQAVGRLAVGLAAALAEIHHAGLAHRDLKPGNVILAEDGPRVIDFGIARATDGTTELTHAGDVLGSPAFMSPEQAEGRQAGQDSDIFSWAALVVTAATGRSPCPGNSAAQILYNVVHHEPDLRMLPPGLRRVVEMCLAKDPALRPTAHQVLRELPSADPDPQPWPPPVHAAIAQRKAMAREALSAGRPRYGWKIGIAVGAVALLAVGAIAVGMSGGTASPAPLPATTSSGSPPPNQLTKQIVLDVDPCALLDGAPAPGGGVLRPEKVNGFDVCDYRTAGYEVSLFLGRLNTGTRTSIVVEGLQGFTEPPHSSNRCTAYVLLQDTPGLTVAVRVESDPSCDGGKAVLGEAVRRIKAGHGRWTQPESLGPLDPCAAADTAVADRLVGGTAKVRQTGLHHCTWQASAALLLMFRHGAEPSGTPVQANGITLHQRQISSSECALEWAHRPLTPPFSEVVHIQYAGSDADPCAKARDFAAAVIVKLP
ncbi:serine/threonine-protein kinase [Kibdelosporangium persicum]|uniref:Serine/threonine-protein kinase AfsK n=1 Tax=Kibdelosporangium persicum TaxID=2698649 RepID=A0ABX2F143_9PSEU|nr:serine/threonine-protein kinase [Kibdelosporangium persicum]NRN64942.1 Serine/threonine-protein kinase AfsK [Kibdelosporangium persicum]